MMLLDPVGVPGQKPPPGRTSSAKNSVGNGNDNYVCFWLQESADGKDDIKLLGTSHPSKKKSDDGYAIQFFPEVVCVVKHLVLIRIRTPDIGVPTCYFVYSIRKDDYNMVVSLPEVHPKIYRSRSIGLLLDQGDRFSVANLRLVLDDGCNKTENSMTTTMQLQARLDMWSQSYKTKTKWIEQEVLLRFPKGTVEDQSMLYQWQTDQVVSLGNCLLWVDLWLGIQNCSNLLSSRPGEDEDPKDLKFEYIPLPNIQPKRPAYDHHHRRERPEPFRSVACCKGELKLVNLRSPDHHCNSLEVEIWSLKGAPSCWTWSKQGTYMYNNLWETIRADLSFPLESVAPSNKGKPWYFPVLGTHNSKIILYLTLEAQNKAFLLRIDVNDINKVRMTEYPRFCEHRNILHIVDLSTGTDPTADWKSFSIWKIAQKSRKQKFARVEVAVKKFLGIRV